VNSSWALAAAKSTQNWIRHFECIMATWQQWKRYTALKCNVMWLCDAHEDGRHNIASEIQYWPWKTMNLYFKFWCHWFIGSRMDWKPDSLVRR
jgi:hypothetical protein